jgi:hypothetical protein
MKKSDVSSDEIAVEQDVRPCEHMETMVSGLADGSLHGPKRWFTQIHILYCTPCRSAVRNLRTVIDQVSDLREAGADRMPPERRAEIERALDTIDGAPRGKG